MNVTVFSSKSYDKEYLRKAAGTRHNFTFFENQLRAETARLADGADAVCAFVNDDLGEQSLEALHALGVRLLTLRCSGFNNVDLAAAKRLGIAVTRVPAYSPHAVAEHSVGLLLTLNRHIHKAYQRVRDGNFSLEGLVGFDLYGKTVGVVGTGAIGSVFCKLMLGFGCKVLASDVVENPECLEAGVEYCQLDTLLGQSHIISLHCPLVAETKHLINPESLKQCRDGVFLINTSRGALVDTRAVIAGLKTGKIGGLAIDVYEEEADIFFEDRSASIINDDVLMRLTTFHNVLITGHQAFLTDEALTKIAAVTCESLDQFADNKELTYAVG